VLGCGVGAAVGAWLGEAVGASRGVGACDGLGVGLGAGGAVGAGDGPGAGGGVGAGGGGGAVGVITAEFGVAGPVPTELVATTVKVYEVPLVSPVTVAEVAGAATVVVWPPEDVAV